MGTSVLSFPGDIVAATFIYVCAYTTEYSSGILGVQPPLVWLPRPRLPYQIVTVQSALYTKRFHLSFPVFLKKPV